MKKWLKKVIIGEDYLTRWHIVPRNRFFNIYLHKFTGSDDDRAYHDHPWWSISFNLKGKLLELIEENWEVTSEGDVISNGRYRYIRWMFPYIRRPDSMHRMILESDNAWTLFITGPRCRDWGFRVSPNKGGDWHGWMSHVEFFAAFGER